MQFWIYRIRKPTVKDVIIDDLNPTNRLLFDVNIIATRICSFRWSQKHIFEIKVKKRWWQHKILSLSLFSLPVFIFNKSYLPCFCNKLLNKLKEDLSNSSIAL